MANEETLHHRKYDNSSQNKIEQTEQISKLGEEKMTSGETIILRMKAKRKAKKNKDTVPGNTIKVYFAIEGRWKIISEDDLL